MLLGGNKKQFQCSQTIKNIYLFLTLNYLDIFSFVPNYFKIIVTVHPALITRISLEVHWSPYGDRINNSGSKPSTQNPLQYVRSVYLFRNHSSLVPLSFLLLFVLPHKRLQTEKFSDGDAKSRWWLSNGIDNRCLIEKTQVQFIAYKNHCGDCGHQFSADNLQFISSSS